MSEKAGEVNSKDSSLLNVVRENYDGKKEGILADGEGDFSSVEEPPSLTHPMESRVVKKMDLYLLPLMCMLYFLSNLDKSNIGNADLAGLSDSLGLEGNQYGNAVTVLFATYIFFDPISAVFLKIIGPRYMMTGCLLCFGGISLGTAWIKTYGHLLAVRILLGTFSAAIYPSINMYLSICYRREQYAMRFAWVFFAACISSSFGGLISYGCAQINGALEEWQYIYIIEGSLSLFFVPFYYFGLRNNLENSWFFNEEESNYIVRRYKSMNTFDPSNKFEWFQVWLAVKDIKTWVSAAALFGIDLTTFGLTVYMPTIITSMGFSSVHAQLLTVPVYFLTAISSFGVAVVSDRMRLRSPFIIGGCILCATGISIMLGSHVDGVRFFGIFVLAPGIFVNASMNCLWLSGNNGNYFKRAAALGVNLFVGASSGLVSGQIFITSQKPQYSLGLSVCLGLLLLSTFLTIVQFILYRRANMKKEAIIKECEDRNIPIPYDERLSDLNPEFKYMY